MDPERFKQIERLYDAALEVEEGRRAAFLRQACAGDEPLRQDLESALANGSRSFLEVPAWPEAARDLGLAVHLETETLDKLATGSPETRHTQVGEYRILRMIGHGGMGTVYAAYQESMHRNVALKILEDAPVFSEGASRFEREAWIAGRLSHPNIVKVHAYGVAGNARYIAMELIEGPSLHEEIREAKKIRAERTPADSDWRNRRLRMVVELFVAAADALHYVHQQGILHRDIKPSNLLLNQERTRLLLTDFGLAREEDAANLTRRGEFLGTVRYMSPEQLLAQRAKVDRRSDIWSLGVTFYEALTLDLPYAADTDEAYISAVAMKQPIPARDRSRTVPRDLETVLMKCMERDPERRYATAAEFKDDLARFLENRPVQARRPGAILKAARLTWRHRLPLGAAAIAAILVLAVVGALVSRSRHQTEIDRVRWTLQQVINSPQAEPHALQPDWPQLLNVLHREIRKNPNRDLALLAQRAACRVTGSAPSFGLLSELPDLEVVLKRGIDPGRPFLNIVYVEGALDEGPWEPIGSAAYQDIRESFSEGDSLDKFFPAAELTPTHHEIKFRATLRLVDPNKLSVEAKDEFSKRKFVFGPFDKAWPAARNVVPLFTETRALEPVSIDLFKEYPKDFPRKVFASQATGPPQSWFHLDRIRFVRVKLPAGNAPGFAIEWPQEKYGRGRVIEENRQTYCATPDLAERTNPVVGIEFFGRLETPIPLAGDATVWSDRTSKLLLSFPIVWGHDQLNHLGNAGISGRSDGPAWWYNMANFAAAKHTSLPTLPDEIEDGIASGRIDLAPSRSIALATKYLDRYFGEKVSIPIPSVEVVTVAGEWLKNEGCR